MAQSNGNGQSCLGDIFLPTNRRESCLALAIVCAEPNHPAALRWRADFAAFPRSSAISTGPS